MSHLTSPQAQLRQTHGRRNTNTPVPNTLGKASKSALQKEQFTASKQAPYASFSAIWSLSVIIPKTWEGKETKELSPTETNDKRQPHQIGKKPK